MDEKELNRYMDFLKREWHLGITEERKKQMIATYLSEGKNSTEQDNGRFTIPCVKPSLPEKVKELLLFAEKDGEIVNGFRVRCIVNELRALVGNGA
jgi:hypothetical protein